MVESIVTVHCNCRAETFLPGLVQVVPCKWTYMEENACPEVPQEKQFNWECDPRFEECPSEQYMFLQSKVPYIVCLPAYTSPRRLKYKLDLCRRIKNSVRHRR